MTWQTKHSVIANATRETVWEFYSNVDNWARLEGAAVESITLDGPFRAGANGITKAPGQPPRLWRLAEVAPPERVVIETQLDDAVVRMVWTFDQLPEDRTRLSQRIALEGPGAEAYVVIMEEHFAPTIGQGMQRMADEIEKYAVGQ